MQVRQPLCISGCRICDTIKFGLGSIQFNQRKKVLAVGIDR
jgi:hypothetical protein